MLHSRLTFLYTKAHFLIRYKLNFRPEAVMETLKIVEILRNQISNTMNILKGLEVEDILGLDIILVEGDLHPQTDRVPPIRISIGKFT